MLIQLCGERKVKLVVQAPAATPVQLILHLVLTTVN
jgi:hypothetical protein